MSPKLSVVVPFHNDESRLEECLESLARQTMGDVEVVMVDDGSTDSGPVLAKAMAQRDGRFVLLQKENAGLGAARNHGARHASGKFIAFVDAGDTVPARAYGLLVGSLERTGSDLACGHAAGLPRVEAAAVTGGHISTAPKLLEDRSIHNKVYRRTFWEAHRFEFADGHHHEALIAVRAHLLATAVDVLADTVYIHRPRPTAVSQGVDAVEARHRLEVVRDVSELVTRHAPKLLPDHHRAGVVTALTELIEALPRIAPDARQGLVGVGRELLATLDPRVRAGRPAITRLGLHLLERGLLDELLELAASPEWQNPLSAPVVRKGLVRTRWYAKYPYHGDARRSVPTGVYDVTDELRLKGGIDAVTWHDGTLCVTGHAYVDRIDAAGPDDSRIRVVLRETKRGKEIELDVERTQRPDVTAESAQTAACYDGSGFLVRIDPAQLVRGMGKRGSTWAMHVEVTQRGLKRGGALGGTHRSQAKWIEPVEAADGVWIQPVLGDDDFLLQTKRGKSLITEHRVEDGRLIFEGRLGKRPGDGATVVAASRSGNGRVEGEAEIVAAEGGGFAVRLALPLATLPESDSYSGAVTDDVHALEWEVVLKDGDTDIKLWGGPGLAETRYPLAGQEFLVTRTRYGNLKLVQRICRPAVARVEWGPGERLMLTGDFAGGDDPAPELFLRHRRTAEEHAIDVRWDGPAFEADLAPGAMPGLAGRLPLARGTWDLLARTGEGARTVVIERSAIPALPDKRRVGVHELEVRTYQGDAVCLRVTPALADDEHGAYAQHKLQTSDYPSFRAKPLRDVVVFDAYRGRQYSCNPRAVFERLREQGSDLDCVWITRDGQYETPDGARTVLMGTREHYELMATARYLVCNGVQPPWFDKRDDQIYVQCWHGTPLKRIGWDAPIAPHRREQAGKLLHQEVVRWDVLVSPNPFTSQVMRRAYQYKGEILESGYPRNDVLNSPDRDRIAAETRARLGIPEGKKVVLYAPTWRDDDHIAAGRHKFDLALDLEHARRALGEDHVVLLRTHYSTTDRSWSQVDRFAVDVSKYPDMAELNLVADVLVTDYSSALFDFAVTGKPMVFFAYDLESYRDRAPGFCFDFEAEAPGPVVRTSEEVVAAVQRIDEVAREHADAYAAFTAKFCPYDDGHAAERVIKRFLELGERR